MQFQMMNNRVNGRVNTAPSQQSQSRKIAARFVPRAAAATELSPKEAGVDGAANQLDALKQMSKIVADSGVCHSCIYPYCFKDELLSIELSCATMRCEETSML